MKGRFIKESPIFQIKKWIVFPALVLCTAGSAMPVWTRPFFLTVKIAAIAFEEFILKYPHKFARIIRSINSTGDNLEGTKNCRRCFDVFGGAKNCANIWLAYSEVLDCYDCDHFGKNSQDS